MPNVCKRVLMVGAWAARNNQWVSCQIASVRSAAADTGDVIIEFDAVADTGDVVIEFDAAVDLCN